MTDPEATGCAWCAERSFAWLTAAFPYVDPLRAWLRRAKFGPEPGLARGLVAAAVTAWLRTGLLEELSEAVVVPIPPSDRASVWRGPSLAQRLATHLAGEAGIPTVPLLTRRRPGVPQRRRDARSRRRLAPSVYTATRTPTARMVLLVDDVATTGATLEAAARALRDRWPGLEVAAAVLARTDAPVVSGLGAP